MSRDTVAAPAPGVVAAVFVSGRPEGYLPTVASLRAAHPDLDVIVGAADVHATAPLAELGVHRVAAPSASVLVNEVWEGRRCHVLAVTDTAVLPTAALEPALGAVNGDMRIATVSFLCNAAAFLSFPFRNTPVSHQVESLDEEAITRLLRTVGPDQPPAPIPVATGPAVLFSSFALSAVGPLADPPGLRPAVAVADYSLRARRKGFLDVVDPSTFCARPYDLAPVEQTWLDEAEHAWLVARHDSFPAIVEQETLSETSAVATVHAAARAKVLGLRVLVDGTCLGPKEMGTQVQTISLVGALARRRDVEQVGVALATDVPGYAGSILAEPKVNARFVVDGDVTGFGRVDVAHRPFQPDGPMNPSWFKMPARTVVTIQDLTSYHVGIYHQTTEKWLAHREVMRQSIAAVDGVVVISHDVRAHLLLERLPIEAERLFVVQNGTDHLRGDESAAMPRELLARGFAAGEFAVVLGTNYAHKNRDLAIRVVAELRRRGIRISLVLAGAAVPFGSSRVDEARWRTEDDGVHVIPDVTSQERNWLLHHASLVLYPTSAEGFGLVPYEAARFGTPTVLVPFGPLGEVAGDLPVTAADWSPRSLADAAERLLDDPSTADRQVAAALASGLDYTWDATAAKLVEVYRAVLAAQARGGDGRA